MPGIAGIISRSTKPVEQSTLDRMVACMVHEPAYRSGTWSSAALGVAVGWTAHAGSFSDCMPAWNEARDVCLIFSGENLADKSIARDLATRHHDINPHNASYLVHWYEEAGLSFLARLNGFFCGLLVDLRERKAVLFNDRFGMSRINFHETDDAFYFSSEAKSLLHVLPAARTFDPRSLGEFFSAGCVLQNRTLFNGVNLLPGGSAWTFSPGGVQRREQYFQPAQLENQPELPPREYYDALKSAWTKILPRYLNGSEPAAVSLTGGVDSRMIVAAAQSEPGSLPCYTFGGPYRDCADVAVSRRVAGLCGQPHHTIPVGDEFLKEFPAHVERTAYISDGTLDPTGSTDLYVNRRARSIAPVRVTGLNGGEILRRLVMFKAWHPRPGLLTPDLDPHLRLAEQTYAEERRGHPLSFIAFKQSPWHLYPRLSIERSQLTLRSPYFDNEIVALAFRAPRECLDSTPALRLIAETRPQLANLGTDRAALLGGIPGVTRARRFLQDFTFRAEYAYDYGMPQWLARADYCLKPLRLERLFLGRHKFYHYRVWYRDAFAPYLKQVLLDRRALSRPYLNAACVKEIVAGHTAGYANYTLELHRLLTLELAQRQLCETA